MSTNNRHKEDKILVVDYIDITNQEHQCKIEELRATFEQRTGTKMEYLIRAPGRVNIIGDHVDYHGFGVLPMAIESCIWLACSFSPGPGSSSQLNIYNVNQEEYPTFTGNHSLKYGARLDQSHKWHHYILCGYHGILSTRLLQTDAVDIFQHAKDIVTMRGDHQDALSQLRPLNILIDADLPPESGLSSSSALVCASSIAAELLLHDQEGDIALSASRLANDCSKFEHLVGTRGGGMDQAVIMTAQDGYAKYVQFMPNLSCRNVRLPDRVMWLVTHCGSGFAKAATSEFNTRVLQTKLGAALIVEAFDNHTIAVDETITLGKVKREIFRDRNCEEIIDCLRTRVFNEGTQIRTPLSELARKLGADEGVVEDMLAQKSLLLARCEHVFEEGDRVDQFINICHGSRDIKALGKLMEQSHISLQTKYGCSHPCLDRLVRKALDAGALGARLTGAGWGGCLVSMVDQDSCNNVLECLRSASSFTFRTEPKGGCSIIKF